MAQAKRKSPLDLGLVPLEEEEPKTRKRTSDPVALGLVPLEDEPANDDVSPEALGLAPADAPEPVPEEEEGWWDWGEHKASQFLGALQDAFGIEHAPEPANADMEVIAEQPEAPEPSKVPEGKITEPGSVTDFLVPDYAEYAARSIYDFATSDRTWRSLDAGGATMVSSVKHVGANLVMLSKYVDDFIAEELGEDQVSNAARETGWNILERKLRNDSEAYAREAQKVRLPDEERGVIDAIIEALPQIPAMLLEYGVAARILGPIAGFASVDALHHADEGWEGAAKAGAKGAALGAFFEWANILSRSLRIPALAAAGGGLTAMEGGSDADIAAQAILFPVLGLPARSGPVGVRYLREHGVVADLRDMGGHVRDLLIGGNVGRAQQDAQTTGGALAKIRQRHNDERQAEQARYVVEQSGLKQIKPGETQADVNARIETAKRQHEDNVEAMNRRHLDEEQPLRHAYEIAERRFQRAQHPFRMSWQAAPYMRALHSAEQGVLVAHAQGYSQLQSAYKEADQRYQAAKDQAKRLREAETTNPEEAAKNRGLADYFEAEGARLSYEMKAQAEAAIEARITRAEALADRRRFDLAHALGKGNKVEGRRAMWLAADRARQNAYRSGIRVIRQGESRARQLIEMGDEHVRRTERALREDGITPENTETRAQFETQMTRAQEVRETYREMASIELLEAQYRADSRVSRAELTFGQAVDAARLAGVPERELPRRRVEAKRDSKTTPDEARKEDDPDWDPAPAGDPLKTGPEFEHAYRRALEGSKDDPVLAEIAKRVDPILEHIQDPTDVLPAIARIAKELGHDPASRRGRQSESMRKILAERLGMTEDEFIRSPFGKAFSDYELEAAIMLMDRSYARLQRAYSEYRQNPGSAIAKQRVHLELMRFMMIRNRLKGAAAEAGRSLRMFRELKKQYGSLSEPLSDRDLDRIMTYDKPGAVGRIAEKTLKGDWFGAVIEYWINGLLSGAQTWFVNLYSGLNMLAYKPLQTGVAATVGLTRWTVWNFVLRPILSPLIGSYRFLARQGAFGMRERERAMARSQSGGWMYPLRPSEFVNSDRIRFGEVGARMRGYWEALTEMTSNNAFFIFFRSLLTGERYLQETNFGGPREMIPWWLGGHVIRLPGRILQAIDDFVKAMAYRAGLRANAYRQAINESQNVALEGVSGWLEYRRRLRARYQELVKNPTATIIRDAKNEALEMTFQKHPEGGLGEAVGVLRSKVPSSAFLVPFHRVLFNSIEFLLKGTPAGLIYKKMRMDLWGKNGKARQEMAIAHVLLVSGGAVAIYFWALQGNVRGPFASDPKQRSIQGISGAPPLGVRIPGTNEFVSVNRVDPLGGVVALGAAAAEATKTGMAAGDEDAGQRAFSLLVSSVATMTLSRAGMSGLVDFIEALQGGSYGTDIKSLDNFFQKLIGTLTVPQASTVVARTQDPYLRYAHTTMEEIMARIPGQRENLWPVRNMWGDPIKGFDSYGANDVLDLTQPFYWGRLSKDPASVAMMELYEIYRWAPGSLQRNIGGRRLTDQEYDFYAQRAGRIAYEKTKALAKSAEYKDIKRIEREIKDINKQLSSGDPDLLSQGQYKALSEKREQLREELRKKRLAFLHKVQNAHRAARKQARLETAGTADGKVKGRFPEIWKRPRKKDLGRVPGELPAWAENLSAYMEAEDENEEWDAEQREAADQE